MQRVYFIDYENVDTRGLDGLSGLTSNDTVYIFYSEAHCRLTFELHIRIVESSSDINYVKIYDRSKNALDNQLIKKLKELVKSNPKANYYIISNDSDYDASIASLRRKGYKVAKQDCIKAAEENNIKHIEKLIRERIKEDSRKPFNISDKQISEVALAISKAENKSELNSQLQKIFYSHDMKYVFSRLNDLTNYN